MASLIVRKPESIYQAGGEIKNGTFRGRRHFSFDEYQDPEYVHFGSLRVSNDDTLSPGAVWPLHPHRDNEVVTYCATRGSIHVHLHVFGILLRKFGRWQCMPPVNFDSDSNWARSVGSSTSAVMPQMSTAIEA
jgi:hypothetical protein